MRHRRGIGIIGCGTIAPAYLRTLQGASGARVVALADLDVARAAALAEAHGVAVATTPEGLLQRDDVELVVDLTVPAAHASVNRQALESGRHVYSEKPLAATAAEAHALVTLAAERGLALGGAPDTFLGRGLQTARAALDDDAIGRPVAAVAHMVSHGPERWHPDPGFLFLPGAGPLHDMGPYYVTAMVALFGAVTSVSAEGTRAHAERTIGSGPKAGSAVPVHVDTHVTVLLRFASGVVATLLTSFDVVASDLPRFEVFGTDGTLAVPDPNHFDGAVRVRHALDAPWHEVGHVRGVGREARGIGALELLQAHAEGRSPRADGRLAAHVLDVLDGALESMRTGRRIDVDAGPERPVPLGGDELGDLAGHLLGAP